MASIGPFTLPLPSPPFNIADMKKPIPKVPFTRGAGERYLVVGGKVTTNLMNGKQVWFTHYNTNCINDEILKEHPGLRQLFNTVKNFGQSFCLDSFWVRKWHERSSTDEKAIEDHFISLIEKSNLSEPQVSKLVKEYQDETYLQLSEVFIGDYPGKKVYLTISEYFDLIRELEPIWKATIDPKDLAKNDAYNIEDLD